MKLHTFIHRLAPESLLSRSMLIVLVPVAVTLVVLISFFIDRIYHRATVLRTTDAARELNYILSDIDTLNPNLALMQMRAKADPLEIDIALLDRPDLDQNMWVFYDLSAPYIVRTFQAQLPNPVFVDLQSNKSSATLNLELAPYWIEVVIHRARLSAVNPHQLVIWTVLSTVFFFGVAYIFMRNQLRPITHLSNAAVAFGHGQRQPFTPGGTAELRKAGAAFVDMQNRIEYHLEQRKNMLSGVSHDLRTPLTRMKLSLSLLRDQEAAKDINNDIAEMEAIIAEFLEFARGESNKASSAINAVALAKSLLRDYERSGHDIQLLINGPDQARFEFQGRSTSMKRALNNLLDNAFRFAKSVKLSVEQGPKAIIFTIEDNGPGIAKSDYARALRPFERLDDARNRDAQVGSGLGLAIAADIARSHGGTLDLSHSQSLGGLRATLSIPLS